MAPVICGMLGVVEYSVEVRKIEKVVADNGFYVQARKNTARQNYKVMGIVVILIPLSSSASRLG